MRNTSNILIQHIEEFVRKYFKNRLFKGVILFTLLISAVFLALIFVEYFSYLPGFLRAFLFYGYLALFAVVLIRYVLIPVYKLINFRKSMSHKEAAMILGTHFPDVSDKLLNTLQLNEQLLHHPNEELLVATIRQRTDNLSTVQFLDAVNLRENLKYLKWMLIPLLILMVVWIAYPAFVKKPASRIIDYNTHYVKPLPFSVSFQSPLYVTQNENYELLIELDGNEFPDQFYVETNGMKMPMTRLQADMFSLQLKKVSQDMRFKVIGGGYNSGMLLLEVYPKAMMMSFEAKLDFPEYIRRPEELIRDQNWIAVPEGTEIHWEFYTRATEMLEINSDSIRFEASQKGDKWTVKTLAMETFGLEVIAANSKSGKAEPMQLHIEVIKDEWPSIHVQAIDDELLNTNKYFTGIIGDDYGFSRLEFRYKVLNHNEDVIHESVKQLAVDPNLVRQQFYHFINMDSLRVPAGQSVDLQFAVYDNDRVKGPKMRLSAPFSFAFIDKSTLDSVSKSQEENINKQLENALSEAADMKKELSDFNKNLLQKKELDWNDKQQIKDFLERQQSLEDLLNQLKDNQHRLDQFNKENELVNERLLEKQEEINKLIDEVIPDDIRAMMEELQQLLEEMNKDQVAEMLKNLEMNAEKMEAMLDRNLALLQQLKVEKSMNEFMERLEELAKKLEENADATLEKSLDRETLSDNLQEIQDAFEDEMKNLEQIKEENDKLDHPFQLDSTKEDEQQIRQEMESGQQQLQKKKNKESSSDQQSAAGKMQQMRDKLQKMMEMSMQQQLAEDANALRFLLENILRLSIRQEDAMLELHQLKRDDPAYLDIIRDQSIIAETFRTVEDSLIALSKRQQAIQNFIFNEVEAVNMRVAEAQDFMKDRKTANAAGSQQFAMMALNNLALMLAESLKNMQDSMGMPSPMEGDGQCDDGQSPGDGMQNLRQMQESLGNALKNAMEGQSGESMGMMSEDIARMAAQQEAIRNQLKQLMDELKADGDGAGDGLKEMLEDMEQMEERLVNKQLNQELLDMHNDIIVRMLESEKAQKERELEEKREATEFKGENFGNLIDELEYKSKVEMRQDLLRTMPIDLQPYYKRKLNEYYVRFNTQSSYEKDRFK